MRIMCDVLTMAVPYLFGERGNEPTAVEALLS